MSVRTDEAAAKREALQQKLADGIGELITSEEWQRYLAVQARFHRYSFGNALLIMLQLPYATQVMGYGSRDKRTGKPRSGWLSVGRHVRGPDPVTGEKQHGAAIWVPRIRMVDVTDADGNIRYGPDGKPRKREQLTGWDIGYVFDVSQTDGEPLPDPVRLLAGEDDGDVFGQLVKVAGEIGFTVTDAGDAELGAANGDTAYSPDVIRVHRGRSPRQQVKTLAHELGHAILHRDLNPAGPDRPRAELEAESVAFVVLGSLGIDAGEYSFGYVAGWAGAGPEDAEKVQALIKTSGEAIQKAAKTIITTLEGLQP